MKKTDEILLKIIGDELFSDERSDISADDFDTVAKESIYHCVFPLFFSRYLKSPPNKVSTAVYSRYKNLFFTYLASNTGNFAEHLELHELMTKNNVPYTVLKGVASAMYYRDPSLRSMGDVDFLIRRDDIGRADRLVASIGFSIDHGEENDSIHIAYTRPPQSIWEMHRSLNGMPKDNNNDLIKNEVDSIIEQSSVIETEGIRCNVPCRFHHALIMLLHTASHLTSEGIGLRHLCDWAVFISTVSDEEFRSDFKDRLISFGLYKFASILTLLGTKYLNAPKKEWACEFLDKKNINDDYLDAFMTDILNSGNFGKKDFNRYREIKYISDRKSKNIDDSGLVKQGFLSVSEKVYDNYDFINRHRILLPFGIIAEGAKYSMLLITGKRKNTGTSAMLKEARTRKKIYSKLDIFK